MAVNACNHNQYIILIRMKLYVSNLIQFNTFQRNKPGTNVNNEQSRLMLIHDNAHEDNYHNYYLSLSFIWFLSFYIIALQLDYCIDCGGLKRHNNDHSPKKMENYILRALKVHNICLLNAAWWRCLVVSSVEWKKVDHQPLLQKEKQECTCSSRRCLESVWSRRKAISNIDLITSWAIKVLISSLICW